MFMHGSWDHILGNMLFLAIFGKNVEDAFGHLGYPLFYFVGGFIATATQTVMTLLAGSAADAKVPSLGASGAIAAAFTEAGSRCSPSGSPSRPGRRPRRSCSRRPRPVW